MERLRGGIMVVRVPAASPAETVPAYDRAARTRHNGFRWHARSFDRESSEFRDFVLGRLARRRLPSRRDPSRRTIRTG